MLWSYVQLDDGAGRAAQENHSIADEKNSTLPISLDDSTSIDHAVELTITGMPNASGSWRTHDGGYAAECSSVPAARAR